MGVFGFTRQLHSGPRTRAAGRRLVPHPAAETSGRELTVETAVGTNATLSTQSRPHLKAREALHWAQDYHHLRWAAKPSRRWGHFPYRYVAGTCGALYLRHGHALPPRMRITRRFAILPEVEDFSSSTPSLSVGVAHALPGGPG